MKIYYFIRYITLTSICILAAGYTMFSEPTSEVAIYDSPNRLVIVDAGHGGVDGGASSAGDTPVVEKHVNLQIAKKLELILLERGYAVVMTREGDHSLQSESRQGKAADLKARVEIANEQPDGVLISLHLNSFADPKYSGSQIFYSSNSTNSELLASTLQAAIKDGLQPDNDRKIKEAGSEIYLLDNVDLPAIMIECGFLSNPHEAALLSTAEYQELLATCIADGIDTYIKSGK